MNKSTTNKKSVSSSTTSKKPKKKVKPKASNSTAVELNTSSTRKGPKLDTTSNEIFSTEPTSEDVFISSSALKKHEEGSADIQAPKQRSTITLSLLAKRCLSNYQRVQPEQIVELLNEITHVRLDRECLLKIDGLELLGKNVRNLYLQHNDISEIEGLETLPELRFLTLSYNNITQIQNLRNTKLGFLDLSHNAIESFDVEELPTSLVILNLEGNGCQKTDGYRESILGHCTKLSQLDGEPLTLYERRTAGHEVDSESEASDEEVNEELAPYNYNKPFDAEVVGVFDDLSSDIFLRCQSRIQHIYEEHKARVLNLERLKAEGGITSEDGAVSNSASRLSSRLDSPDTTDSSRPDTGNDVLAHNVATDGFSLDLSDMRNTLSRDESRPHTNNGDLSYDNSVSHAGVSTPSDIAISSSLPNQFRNTFTGRSTAWQQSDVYKPQIPSVSHHNPQLSKFKK